MEVLQQHLRKIQSLASLGLNLESNWHLTNLLQLRENLEPEYMLLVFNGLSHLFQVLITFPDAHLAELVRYVVMAQNLSAITVAVVPMQTTSVVTTLFQSVVVLIKPLVLVNVWRETLEMTLIKLVFPLVAVAQLILPRTQTKQTVNKHVMT